MTHSFPTRRSSDLNNAGVVSGLPQFPDVDAARVRWIIDVNITSLVAATQIAVQAMRKRGGGVIVNTVSTVALGTGFYDAMYATTKAAEIGRASCGERVCTYV